MNRQLVAASLKEARRHGHVKYVGEACSTCGSVIRYTSSKSCVDCARARVRESRKRERLGGEA